MINSHQPAPESLRVAGEVTDVEMKVQDFMPGIEARQNVVLPDLLQKLQSRTLQNKNMFQTDNQITNRSSCFTTYPKLWHEFHRRQTCQP